MIWLEYEERQREREDGQRERDFELRKLELQLQSGNQYLQDNSVPIFNVASATKLLP